MQCRSGCAACCIEPSIVEALPNMPFGKPAGEACANLDKGSLRCLIWGEENYPNLCKSFRPEPQFCGTSRDEALQILRFVESATK